MTSLGATTGMVTVVRAVFVSPLPYAAPDELFWIYTDNPPYRFRFSVVDYCKSATKLKRKERRTTSWNNGGLGIPG